MKRAARLQHVLDRPVQTNMAAATVANLDGSKRTGRHLHEVAIGRVNDRVERPIEVPA